MNVPGSHAVPASPTPAANRFLLLDLMRGVAAIAVLVYHASIYLGVQLLPDAYLAVDMFFLLSGFVIAHNYDRKFARGMSLRDFMVQRLIRLYPCFILTLAIGFVLAAARMTRDFGYFDGWRLAAAGMLNAAFLPAYVFPYQLRDIFHFNGSAWSLSFELLANLVYWMIFPHLTQRRLWLLLVGCALAEGFAVAFAGSFDVGMRPSDFWLGVPRVMLPFMLGVVLRRHLFESGPQQLGPAGLCLVFLCLLAAFSLTRFIPPGLLPAAEYGCVALLFPVLLLAVSRTTPGPVLARLCTLTGDASYPVYLLQVPFVGFFAALPQIVLHAKARDFIPMIGIAHIATTFGCALWIDRYYELPLRKWLKARWAARPGQVVA
jgi:peptidoglycan/LPS O-acetylase OafA/YrhL